MTNSMGRNTGGTGAVGNGDNERFALNKALTAFNDAINMLDNVDMWLPTGREHLANQLKPISAPISKALKAYLNKVQNM